MTNAAIFAAAHAETRRIVAEHGVAYRAQFGICLRAAYAAAKAPATVEISTNINQGSYIARITGPDARFGLARAFVKETRVGTDTLGYAASIVDAAEGEVYEIKTQRSRKSVDRELVVIRGGQAVAIDRAEALALVA